MGENTTIEWCHHTFNGWRGCRKVSPGCANCYAEAGSHRNPAVLGGWGNDPRVIGSDTYWRQPLLWDRKAEADGVRRRVFALSLGDWLEDRPELVAPRARLLSTIGATPHLDWLLLTKRPEGWCDRLHEVVRETHDGGDVIASDWLDGFAPHNVWIGVSVEDQATADERIPHLLQVPAAVRFVSAEPLLGPVDLTRLIYRGERLNPLDSRHDPAGPLLDWIICGGESGRNARPMHPDWARAIRDQCVEAQVPYFFKQWGEWCPLGDDTPRGVKLAFVHKERGTVVHAISPYDPGCPCDVSMREADMVRVGKKAAGRRLDGVEWSQFPEASRCD